jgi:uncharacterized membrane protein YkgB
MTSITISCARRWCSPPFSLVIRNGSNMKPMHCSLTSATAPLIFWLYAVFGIRGATYFLGVAEWLFGALLFLGFWNKKLGILGALGFCFSMISTFTIIPFMPDGWAASAGGFPAMTERVAFLMKDLVIFAASFYLLKQDLLRATLSGSPLPDHSTTDSKPSDAFVPARTPGAV